MADEDLWPDNSPEAQAEQQPTDNLKDLREAADRGRKASNELTGAKRELAFVKAGVDTDSKQGQLLMKTFEGDLTPEAIKSYQAEVFGGGEPVTTEPDHTADAAAATARNAMASGAEVPSTESTPDPYQTAAAALNAGMAKGKGRDDARADAFAVIRQAAERGDPKVMAGTNRP